MYKILKIKSYNNVNGILRVIENKDISNFVIKRIFNVKAGKNVVRGNHAHKACKQIFQCLEGKISLYLNDGRREKTITLNHPNKLVLVDTKVWTRQKYLDKKNILIVYCNRLYNKNDYIFDIKNLVKNKNK
tara:strand:- start:508 stop:900 length:393 start_codon:yes stop_codon:yes gene_type:complete